MVETVVLLIPEALYLRLTIAFQKILLRLSLSF
jgi:hypothetical protein